MKKNIRKKPCARDGHSATLFNNQIVFLGGDRHMMSFNDMYLLKLDALNWFYYTIYLISLFWLKYNI